MRRPANGLVAGDRREESTVTDRSSPYAPATGTGGGIAAEDAPTRVVPGRVEELRAPVAAAFDSDPGDAAFDAAASVRPQSGSADPPDCLASSTFRACSSSVS